MSDDAKTWAMIHAERTGLADTLEGLTAQQWAVPSLCAGWTVGDLAAHVLAGAEQTPGSFFAGMLSMGFRFNALMERDARTRSALPKDQIIERLRQRATTTNHPPAPVMAMLGEVVVHGQDIRNPLGLPGKLSEPALNACLDMYTKANFPVGGKKRIAGLRLVSTDSGWSYGDGPEVSGPGVSLMLAMTGRRAGLADLSGEGAAVLGSRM